MFSTCKSSDVWGKVSESEEVSQDEFEFGNLSCNTSHVSAAGKDSQDGIEFDNLSCNTLDGLAAEK